MTRANSYSFDDFVNSRLQRTHDKGDFTPSCDLWAAALDAAAQPPQALKVWGLTRRRFIDRVRTRLRLPRQSYRRINRNGYSRLENGYQYVRLVDVPIRRWQVGIRGTGAAVTPGSPAFKCEEAAH